MAERLIPNFDHLKIAIISPYSMEPTGGVQKHIAGYSKYLENQGHTPTVISPCNPNYIENAKVNFATRRIFLAKVSKHEHNGTVAHVSEKVPVNPVEIARVWKQIQPDVLHTHDPYLSASALEMIIYSRLPHLNSKHAYNFATFHAFNSDDRPMYKIIGLLRYGYDPILDGTIVVSRATQQFAQRFYRRDHELITNGIDTTQFTSQNERLERFSDGKINIVCTGRLEPRKGVKHLLNTYATVKKDHPQIRLIIAGDGPERHELEQMVKRDGIGEVEFLGRVSDEDLPKIYKTADICAFFTTHGEAQGLVLLEAMASNKPVVAGNNPGYSTVINHLENGILIEPKNTQQSAAMMKKLIENEEFRAQIAKQGLTTALGYDWQKVGKQILDYYKKQILKTAH